MGHGKKDRFGDAAPRGLIDELRRRGYDVNAKSPTEIVRLIMEGELRKSVPVRLTMARGWTNWVNPPSRKDNTGDSPPVCPRLRTLRGHYGSSAMCGQLRVGKDPFDPNRLDHGKEVDGQVSGRAVRVTGRAAKPIFD